MCFFNPFLKTDTKTKKGLQNICKPFAIQTGLVLIKKKLPIDKLYVVLLFLGHRIGHVFKQNN
ncbi:hypothetical protein C7E23_17985 [Elizabethkingia anophelis]|nr:hypothetical protein C7E23_17985 [Elizabethkingia anophelis]